MRKFFKDIVEGNTEEVIRQVEKNPELVNAAAKQPHVSLPPPPRGIIQITSKLTKIAF